VYRVVVDGGGNIGRGTLGGGGGNVTLSGNEPTEALILTGAVTFKFGELGRQSRVTYLPTSARGLLGR
jgi:hypothetical protein